MLSNAEIQTLVQVIGTSIGEEFDIAKLRYHRVIVMTDADVDGAHIRTLVLTFLYRHMPELFERGHVYIAVPPLYLVRMGNQQSYLEKDAQLDELLVREKFPRSRSRRAEAPVKLSEAKYGRFQRALHSSRAGRPAPRRLRQPGRRLRPCPPARRERGVDAERGREMDQGRERERLRPRRQGRRQGAQSANRRAGDECSDGHRRACRAVRVPIYEHVRRSYEATRRSRRRVAAVPGFSFGKQDEEAETFESLRALAFTFAKHGIQITRFKGLAEMQSDELWTTTMDPTRRMLVRVDVEDAATTDLWFSRLMGDEVEPRREFIEQNARDVRFLDV